MQWKPKSQERGDEPITEQEEAELAQQDALALSASAPSNASAPIALVDGNLSSSQQQVEVNPQDDPELDTQHTNSIQQGDQNATPEKDGKTIKPN